MYQRIRKFQRSSPIYKTELANMTAKNEELQKKKKVYKDELQVVKAKNKEVQKQAKGYKVKIDHLKLRLDLISVIGTTGSTFLKIGAVLSRAGNVFTKVGSDLAVQKPPVNAQEIGPCCC